MLNKIECTRDFDIEKQTSIYSKNIDLFYFKQLIHKSDFNN